jgi:hypothetical protein
MGRDNFPYWLTSGELILQLLRFRLLLIAPLG